MTFRRDRKIEREIATSVRLAQSTRPIGKVPATLGVPQPYRGKVRDYRLPDEPSFRVCMFITPFYPRLRNLVD